MAETLFSRAIMLEPVEFDDWRTTDSL
jgi:hypothetical protein